MAPACKPSMIADESGLITGQAVAPSSETAVVETLLGQHAATIGEPTSLSMDAGYSNEKTFTVALDRDLNLLVPAGREGSEKMKPIRKDGCFVKEDFRYDETSDTYRCRASQRLVAIKHGR
jgi:hypothetical protein